MSTLTDVAKRMTKAWEDRDEAAFRAVFTTITRSTAP